MPHQAESSRSTNSGESTPRYVALVVAADSALLEKTAEQQPLSSAEAVISQRPSDIRKRFWCAAQRVFDEFNVERPRDIYRRSDHLMLLGDSAASIRAPLALLADLLGREFRGAGTHTTVERTWSPLLREDAHVAHSEDLELLYKKVPTCGFYDLASDRPGTHLDKESHIEVEGMKIDECCGAVAAAIGFPPGQDFPPGLHTTARRQLHRPADDNYISPSAEA